ncbi:Putative activity regulator of membrane protease YbbK [Rubellimicrobium mesophilum DSM 19309]|uniref:Putative activity regulator of membrane protease YbbK n=1 Tax=Rubellimicrobium mesophilum DSM 19309 TaxID=442562 RepID=A0A017HMI0_9RHOB|nr:hypothetical protein [Rubellimicrobium mesophilum]EYD74984.1 Putative activity regulator of membrane protease YbbK [Rubellimicrobium mesophilum DSM 19309]
MWWLLWWVWVAVAIVLGVLEVLAPVFVFLGFSAGAMGTALLVGLGLDTGIGGTLLIFAVLSAAAYAVLRMWLGTHKGSARIVERDINEN